MVGRGRLTRRQVLAGAVMVAGSGVALNEDRFALGDALHREAPATNNRVRMVRRVTRRAWSM